MNLRTAYTTNPNRATKLQLELAIQEMKRQYSISSKAIQRRGETSELMQTVEERISTNPSLYQKRVSELTVNEAREVFTTYRDYHAHRTYDKTSGQFTGYAENKTRTLTGYQGYVKDVGQEVLDFPEYENLTQEQRSDLWDIIDKVRKSPDGMQYFLSSKISPDKLYQSGRNIKLVMNYIKNGITDPNEILRSLQENVLNNTDYDEELEIPF